MGYSDPLGEFYHLHLGLRGSGRRRCALSCDRRLKNDPRDWLPFDTPNLVWGWYKGGVLFLVSARWLESPRCVRSILETCFLPQCKWISDDMLDVFTAIPLERERRKEHPLAQDCLPGTFSRSVSADGECRLLTDCTSRFFSTRTLIVLCSCAPRSVFTRSCLDC